MIIEQISENQIRCTLSKEDLNERHMKISELAYGSDKARELFRDMMEQAHIDFGFEADDIPLMIEALPVSKDSLVLLITKVENPDEFDDKFSKLGLQTQVDDYDEDYEEFDVEDDEVKLDNMEKVNEAVEQLHQLIEEVGERERKKEEKGEFVPLSESLKNKDKKDVKLSKRKKVVPINEKVRVFSFSSLNSIMGVARMVSPEYTGKNSVWKDEENKKYYLLLNKGVKKGIFQSACLLLSEFGKEESVTYATQDYYNEHFKLIIKDKAIEQLAKL